MFSAQQNHYSVAALCQRRRLFLDKIATPKSFGTATAEAQRLGIGTQAFRLRAQQVCDPLLCRGKLTVS